MPTERLYLRWARIFSRRVKLLGKEIIVIFQLETEQRKGFDEAAASDDHLGAATGD